MGQMTPTLRERNTVWVIWSVIDLQRGKFSFLTFYHTNVVPPMLYEGLLLGPSKHTKLGLPM